jgi:hypothetical protein
MMCCPFNFTSYFLRINSLVSSQDDLIEDKIGVISIYLK